MPGSLVITTPSMPSKDGGFHKIMEKFFFEGNRERNEKEPKSECLYSNLLYKQLKTIGNRHFYTKLKHNN